MNTPVGIHGDVDADGEIVDSALRRRLRKAIGDRAADITVESQLSLTLTLLRRAREAAV